jgi:hypothetical protein
VTADADEAVFVHVLDDDNGGYVYEKRVKLIVKEISLLMIGEQEIIMTRLMPGRSYHRCSKDYR